jgi:putative toxin-antitoxin system antitoxin component (TIGR02293 family)
MAQAHAIIEALGGTKTFHRRLTTLADLKEQIRKGLPYAAFEQVLDSFDLSRDEVARALTLPLRTLARRKIETRLHAGESDKVLRLARIALLAADVLGSAQKASSWLRRPNRALGHETPLSLLDTEIGARQVEDLLGRIEHGVHS